MHGKFRHTVGAESGLACVASQALAGSVVCFPRPTCQNDRDGDKKKEAACSWEVGSCGPCRVVLSVNEFVVCVRARRCRRVFLLFVFLCLLHIRGSLRCLVVLVAQRW